MQTFLPYRDFSESASVLDNKRLGKQRVENFQILKAIVGIYKGEKVGWQNHPATLMWVPNPRELFLYHDQIVDKWVSRGFQDTTWNSFLDLYVDTFGTKVFPDLKFLGWEPFHASHRSNLLRKDPEHYGQFGWTEPHDLPYIWPSKVL
jgi:hypothetical protein